MNEADYITYFENIAIQNKSLNHNVDGKKSFFYVDNPYETDEIDNAIRNQLQFPAMLLETPDGVFDNNESTNHTDTINGAFSIISKATSPADIRTLRNTCKQIGINILARMQKDSRENKIKLNKLVHFRIDEVSYQPLGPMGEVGISQCFGWMFVFRFVCPFSFSVTSSNWRDIL